MDSERTAEAVELPQAFEGMAVPEPEPTDRPTGAHPDLYDGVHQRLQQVLAQIDQQDAGR
jgi:hypothetical protein